MKTLIVVSGGDAPGINAAVARFSELAGEVVGAVGGPPGLLSGQIVPITPSSALPWAGLGGAFLQTSRQPVFQEADAPDRLHAALRANAVDNLLLFGGNGSLKYIPPLLNERGIACIGIPSTIDNDVPGTQMTLGFDSACNFAYHSIDALLATAHALPGRVFTLETLGGGTGFLALAVAYGADADVVLVPEYSYDLEWVAARLTDAIRRKGRALLVLSEGVKEARALPDELAVKMGIRVRDVRLGHTQRGGTPSHQDRILAAEMARVAYSALCREITLGVTVVKAGRVALHEGLLPDVPVLPDRSLYRRINGLDAHDSPR